jgi:hypothetical protein
MGPTQSHILWLPVAVLPGKSGRSVKLTTYLHIVTKFIIVKLYYHYLVSLHAEMLN